MEKSDSIASLAKALAMAQAVIKNPIKSSENSHFKSKYADLAEVLDMVRPALSSNGLSVTQMPGYDNGLVTVTTMLMHESGEYICHTSASPINKQDAQGVGAATTYLRRYGLAAVAGVAQDDDDANSVSNLPPPRQQPQRAVQPSLTASKAVSNDAIGKATTLAASIKSAKTIDEVNNLAVMAGAIEQLPANLSERLKTVISERIEFLTTTQQPTQEAQ